MIRIDEKWTSDENEHISLWSWGFIPRENTATQANLDINLVKG